MVVHDLHYIMVGHKAATVLSKLALWRRRLRRQGAVGVHHFAGILERSDGAVRLFDDINGIIVRSAN